MATVMVMDMGMPEDFDMCYEVELFGLNSYINRKRKRTDDISAL